MPPDQPATQGRSIRFPEDIWDEIERRAEERGETYTDVVLRLVRRGLRDYDD